MRLSEILKKSGIIIDLNSKKKTDALEEILQALADTERIEHEDIPDILNSLIAREEVMSTGIGNGVAFPHIRHPCVTGLIVAVGRSKEGIEWQSIDGEPVYLIFLVLGPEFARGPLVQCMAWCTRLCKHHYVCKYLFECDKEEVIKFIGSEEQKLFERR